MRSHPFGPVACQPAKVPASWMELMLVCRCVLVLLASSRGPCVLCGKKGKARGLCALRASCQVWLRRRATLPHSVGCSTIAVQGLSFRVRNGTGRLPLAMAAANLLLSGEPLAGSLLAGGLGTGWWTLLIVSCVHGLSFRVVCIAACGALPDPHGLGLCRASPLVPVGSTARAASTSGLSTTCSAWGVSGLAAQGILILERASRLDAFSGYPFRTQPTGGATGVTTGVPEVRPPRSSRTMGRSPQYSDERRG